MLSLETHLGVTASPQAPFPTDYVTLPVSASHRRFGSLPLAAEEGHAPVLQRQLLRVLHSRHAQAASPPYGRATLAGRTPRNIPRPQLIGRRRTMTGDERCYVVPSSAIQVAPLERPRARGRPTRASVTTNLYDSLLLRAPGGCRVTARRYVHESAGRVLSGGTHCYRFHESRWLWTWNAYFARRTITSQRHLSRAVDHAPFDSGDDRLFIVTVCLRCGKSKQ